MAEKIHLRICQIHAAQSVDMLVYYRVGRCHPLIQNRRGQYSMDLVHPFRLIFERSGDVIEIVKILEIADYH
jgi:proteic killer suppression protein